MTPWKSGGALRVVVLRPLRAEKSGWHWLAVGGSPFLAFWDAEPIMDRGIWREPVHWTQLSLEGKTYLGPCLQPAEVAALVDHATREEREACAAVAQGYAAVALSHGSLPVYPHACAAQVAEEIAGAIRARGVPAGGRDPAGECGMSKPDTTETTR